MRRLSAARDGPHPNCRRDWHSAYKGGRSAAISESFVSSKNSLNFLRLVLALTVVAFGFRALRVDHRGRHPGVRRGQLVAGREARARTEASAAAPPVDLAAQIKD